MSSDLYALAGAYVLDALDDDERQTFEAFMATSPEARAEVESLREATALLGAAAYETPPEGLKMSVMAGSTRSGRIGRSSSSTARAAVATATSPRRRAWVTSLSRGARRRRRRHRRRPRRVAGPAERPGRHDPGDRRAGRRGRGRRRRPAGPPRPRPTVAHLSALISAEPRNRCRRRRRLSDLDADDMYVVWAIAGGRPRPRW